MMNLDVSKQNEIKKQLFTLKSPVKNGLILRIHHTDKNLQKIRFIHCCFNSNSQILACCDNVGNVFVIDFSSQKFWNLPNISSSTVITFSHLNPNDLLIGLMNGDILIVDIESGSSTGKLIGHKYPVRQISFSHDYFRCLTSSRCEAIMWDLTTNTKVQILALGDDCALKIVVFMPVTSNILACFKNDLIQVWKYETYDTYKQVLPAVWGSFSIRHIAFTRNGRDMVLAGHSAQLVVFQLNMWKLSHLITLPEYVLSVKHIEFIPQSFDGGSNRILAVLSGQGIIYFYDLDENKIISELASHWEITKFDCGLNGNYLACCLCTGEVEVHSVVYYIVPPVETNVRAVTSDGKIRLRRNCSKIGFVKREICEILDIEKLREILKEFGEYPESYRLKIWEHLLALPNKKDQYNAIINHVTVISFENLYKNYPLENKANLKNLKKLLNNLVTWCPFFSHVEYFPVFCFPFVRVFANKPVACFEAMCTILINWCQYWFEYFPLPPMNILAIIENILLEHDTDLVEHFAKHNVTSREYAWPLLETAFSEVLTSSQWLAFWDHVLSNEPSFLLCATVSYCIVQKTTLLNLRKQQHLHCFFHSQNPLDMRKFIAKTYSILNTTSESMHPRQYLNMFTRIGVGQYPKFMDYPKAIIDYQTEEMKLMKEEAKKLDENQVDLISKFKDEKKFVQDIELEEVEKQRVFEMENALKQKLLEEHKKIQERQERLVALRQQLQQGEEEILESSKKKIQEYSNNQRKRVLESLITDLKLGSSIENFKSKKAEEGLLKHYNELMKHKHKIEMMLSLKNVIPEKSPEEQELAAMKKKLDEEIAQIHKLSLCQDHLKQMNIATGLKAVDELIHKVEDELVREQCQKNTKDDISNDLRVAALKAESKELESQVQKLLRLLADVQGQKNGGSNGNGHQRRTSLTLPHDQNIEKIIPNTSQEKTENESNDFPVSGELPLRSSKEDAQHLPTPRSP